MLKLITFSVGPFFYEAETPYKKGRWTIFWRPPITLCVRSMTRVFGKSDTNKKYDLLVSLKYMEDAEKLEMSIGYSSEHTCDVGWRKPGTKHWNKFNALDGKGVEDFFSRMGVVEFDSKRPKHATVYLKWREHVG